MSNEKLTNKNMSFIWFLNHYKCNQKEREILREKLAFIRCRDTLKICII